MESGLVFRVLLLVLFVGFVAHRAYYTRRLPAVREETIEEHESGTAARLAGLLALPGLLGVLAYIINPEWMAWSSLSLPGWLRWPGVALAVAGFALLQWSHMELGRNWSDKPRITEEQFVVMSGPYRRIRHPIYLAFLLILGSPLLIAANWFIGGVWLVMTVVDVASRITFEEKAMLARFGDDYRHYMASTGALLPPIR